jgi:hypothetical protein
VAAVAQGGERIGAVAVHTTNKSISWKFA